jgi:hypothetical protein
MFPDKQNGGEKNSEEQMKWCADDLKGGRTHISFDLEPPFPPQFFFLICGAYIQTDRHIKWKSSRMPSKKRKKLELEAREMELDGRAEL